MSRRADQTQGLASFPTHDALDRVADGTTGQAGNLVRRGADHRVAFDATATMLGQCQHPARVVGRMHPREPLGRNRLPVGPLARRIQTGSGKVPSDAGQPLGAFGMGARVVIEKFGT